MQPDEVARIAARTVPGSGPASIESLSRGLVNASYRVVREGRCYVLRVASASSRAATGSGALELGLDRDWEMRVLKAAAGAGLAPSVEYCDPQADILLLRWAMGRTWSPQEVQEPQNLQTIGALLRRIQALPAPMPARAMSPAAWIEFYRHALARSSARAARLPRARGSADVLLAALERFPAAQPVLCHGDMHRLNLLDDKGCVLALDWEYSHVSDPLWDLAGWSSNNDLDQAIRQRLLSSYLQRPPAPADASRLELLAALYDHLCLLWSELYLNQRPEEGADQGLIERMQRLAARLDRRPVVE